MCFRFLLLDEPCPSDYAKGHRFSPRNSASFNRKDIDGKDLK